MCSARAPLGVNLSAAGWWAGGEGKGASVGRWDISGGGSAGGEQVAARGALQQSNSAVLQAALFQLAGEQQHVQPAYETTLARHSLVAGSKMVGAYRKSCTSAQ